jgi:hypothetical protein
MKFEDLEERGEIAQSNCLVTTVTHKKTLKEYAMKRLPINMPNYSADREIGIHRFSIEFE